jgi:phosphoadenosine phosphosulfate reductase
MKALAQTKSEFDETEVAAWAQWFEGRAAEDLLEWAVARFAPKLVMTSSFGPEGIVLIDKLSRIAPQTPVIFLDTGFHFNATHEVKEQVRARFNLNLIEQRAALSVAEQDVQYGAALHARQPDVCCRLRKVEPLKGALAGYHGWLSALRRDQATTRAKIAKVEWQAKHQLVKLNPLADWTRAQVWDYVVRHRLPYNRLHDAGYTSVGCEPCTRPVTLGAHERSGRWAGQGKVECGIHL